MHVSALAWIITLVVLVGVLLFDVLLVGRRPHTPSVKECVIAVSVYIGLALLFGVGVSLISGPRYAGEFINGWLTEYSLSVDNLFVFLIIMNKMKVPRHLQQFALLVGIILALVFRGVFIALGGALIAAASWMFFLFGAFLIYTAINLVREHFDGDEDEVDTENLLTRWVKRRIPATNEWHGTQIFVHEGGRRMMTPMLLVIIALGSTDLLFALDSIPAIYGLTREPYLVFAATVFALMGLRQLYFLLGGMLKKLVYLSLGLSVILAFIGVKMILEAADHYGWDERFFHFHFHMAPVTSLLVIVGVLALTIIASLVKSSRSETVDESV